MGSFFSRTLPIYGKPPREKEEIGRAPVAIRPSWLPLKGPGQKNVEPLRWSMTIEQWIWFVRACINTDTWKALVDARRDEYEISMYDVNEHFVKPWTAGTGSSIALLMNATSKEHQPVELMLSHAWAGSVIETYNCLQNLCNNHDVHSSTPIFFCVFSMYQPEDNVAGGITIAEQLTLNPFAKIIQSKPTHGMKVLHTTTFEVYKRLWTVHEVDESKAEHIDISGLFDLYRWNLDKFLSVQRIETEKGECAEKDKEKLTGLIDGRGGFGRLDEVIATFRGRMSIELEKSLKEKLLGNDRNDNNDAQQWHRFENNWWEGVDHGGTNGTQSWRVEWEFHIPWTSAMQRVDKQLGTGTTGTAYPMGAKSFPFGRAVNAVNCDASIDDPADYFVDANWNR